MFETFINSINSFAEASLGEPLLAIPIYILAGLASSLFPCVYPLIPVTVGFLQNRSQPGQSRFIHPLFYWLGTIIAYSLLGLIAAVSGGTFNVWLQNGWVITAFGFLFLYLAFVTMDWAHLNFNTGDKLVQQASQHSGLFFTSLMGLAAGFVASACVAPALFAMLLFIAKHSAAASGSGYLLTIGYGTLLSTSFGAGIGLPFFLAGVLGARLPKSGTWMQAIKYTFAILIAAYAALELQKGLTVIGVSSMNIWLILSGIGLLFGAVLLGLKPPAAEDLSGKTRFFFALLALAFGLGLIIGPIASTSKGEQTMVDTGPEAGQDPLYDQTEMIGNLKFYRSDAQARQIAQHSGKPVFIDFYADWCSNCKDFSKLIQQPGALNSALQDVVLLKIYDKDPVFEKYAATEDHKELNIGLPYFVVLAADGKVAWEGVNYKDSAGMLQAIEQAWSK
ncbi:MAG: thioredoxin family protein [Leptospiraceae bacterium]|nr:thioredoxin family protein [Leptospiraceae bacterium]